jgi:hypothetical protein
MLQVSAMLSRATSIGLALLGSSVFAIPSAASPVDTTPVWMQPTLPTGTTATPRQSYGLMFNVTQTPGATGSVVPSAWTIDDFRLSLSPVAGTVTIDVYTKAGSANTVDLTQWDWAASATVTPVTGGFSDFALQDPNFSPFLLNFDTSAIPTAGIYLSVSYGQTTNSPLNFLSVTPANASGYDGNGTPDAALTISSFRAVTYTAGTPRFVGTNGNVFLWDTANDQMQYHYTYCTTGCNNPSGPGNAPDAGVPEPASLALLAIGGVALSSRRRKFH